MKRRGDEAAANGQRIHRMEHLSFQVKKRARRCCACKASYTSGFRYSSAAATSRVYSNSPKDPNAMSRKCRNSLRPLREAPSTMLAGAENAARRACEVRPYSSCLGKLSVAL